MSQKTISATQFKSLKSLDQLNTSQALTFPTIHFSYLKHTSFKTTKTPTASATPQDDPLDFSHCPQIQRDSLTPSLLAPLNTLFLPLISKPDSFLLTTMIINALQQKNDLLKNCKINALFVTFKCQFL